MTNQKRTQHGKPIDVILMVGDGPLSKGIETLLFRKKHLHTHSIALCNDEELVASLGQYGQKRKKVVILDQNSSNCLIGLLSNPDVMEIILVNSDSNLVQVLKKQKIMLTDKADFAKLF